MLYSFTILIPCYMNMWHKQILILLFVIVNYCCRYLVLSWVYVAFKFYNCILLLPEYVCKYFLFDYFMIFFSCTQIFDKFLKLFFYCGLEKFIIYVWLSIFLVVLKNLLHSWRVFVYLWIKKKREMIFLNS